MRLVSVGLRSIQALLKLKFGVGNRLRYAKQPASTDGITEPMILIRFMAVGLLTCALARQSLADMFTIEFQTGFLYAVSSEDASLTFVGDTELSLPGGLAYHDSDLFSFTAGDSPELYRIDPQTGTSTFVANIDVPQFSEGALTFSPEGKIYAAYTGFGGNPSLVTYDLHTGVTGTVGPISSAPHDINGLVWRDDGMLLGLDRITNSLLTIDPHTAVASELAKLEPAVGGAGGMTMANNGQGYLATGSDQSNAPGTNSLYSFNPYSGDISFVGEFDLNLTDLGLSGLAYVPEPAASYYLAVALSFLVLRLRDCSYAA